MYAFMIVKTCSQSLTACWNGLPTRTLAMGVVRSQGQFLSLLMSFTIGRGEDLDLRTGELLPSSQASHLAVDAVAGHRQPQS
jgi:hypothetical protein